MHNTLRRTHGIYLAILLFASLLSVICSESRFYAAFSFEPIRVPGGTVTDDASFSAALGGHVLIHEDHDIELTRDVILDAPLVIHGGEYTFDGAGCRIIRGFEDGDLIVVEAKAKVTLGDFRKEGEDVALQITGGITSTVDENKNLSLSLSEQDAGINPENVSGALIKIKEESEVTMYLGTELMDNHSQLDGGGVVCDNGSFVMMGGLIKGCSSLKSGGILFVTNQGEFDLASGEIGFGYAGECGGNLAITNGGKAFLSAGLITSGTASLGGGIYADGILEMHSCEIKNNTAVKGGAIYYNVNQTLSGGSISENSAEYGGAIFNHASELKIEALSADKCTAVRGGGIYNEGGLIIDDCVISQMVAEDCGGGIYNAENATLTMNRGTLGSSEAPRGGGLFNAGTCVIHGCSISTNRGEMGAGIMNIGELKAYNGFYCSSGNAVFLVLGENGKGSLTLMESITAVKYPLIVPGTRLENGDYAADYKTQAALLTGSAEAIQDAAGKFEIAANGSTSYALTADGYLKIKRDWLIPTIIGGVAIAVVTVSILLLVRRRKAR